MNSLRCIYNPVFDKPKARKQIMQPMPGEADFCAKKRNAIFAFNLSLTESIGVCSDPVLTKEQEQHLFRKMNYCLYRASRCLPLQNNNRKVFEKYHKIYLEARTQLARSNYRLVFSICHKFTNADASFGELMSEGQVTLLRAIDKFDYSRGYKFSTYLVGSLIRNINRLLPIWAKNRAKWSSFDFEISDRHHRDDVEYRDTLENDRKVLNKMLNEVEISSRSRIMFELYYGLNKRPRFDSKTLAHMYNITPHNVQSTINQVVKKLKNMAKSS
jgi:RNA polymerase sigma factor (sigma-70 family)